MIACFGETDQRQSYCGFNLKCPLQAHILMLSNALLKVLRALGMGPDWESRLLGGAFGRLCFQLIFVFVLLATIQTSSCLISHHLHQTALS